MKPKVQLYISQLLVRQYTYFFSSLGFLSKNGFLEEALTGIANTALQSFSQFIRCAASPAENITRDRKSTRLNSSHNA